MAVTAVREWNVVAPLSRAAGEGLGMRVHRRMTKPSITSTLVLSVLNPLVRKIGIGRWEIGSISRLPISNPLRRSWQRNGSRRLPPPHHAILLS